MVTLAVQCAAVKRLYEIQVANRVAIRIQVPVTVPSRIFYPATLLYMHEAISKKKQNNDTEK